MTALWQALDANQQAVLACGLTMLAGLFLGATYTSWLIHRTPRRVDDDPQSEYRDAAAAHADGPPLTPEQEAEWAAIVRAGWVS